MVQASRLARKYILLVNLPCIEQGGWDSNAKEQSLVNANVLCITPKQCEGLVALQTLAGAVIVQ